MWNKIMRNARKDIPPFNNYLLLHYRPETMEQLPEYLDVLMGECVKLFGVDKVSYVGYEEVTPEEYLQQVLSKKPQFRGIDINRQNLKLLRFNFEMDGVHYDLTQSVPFMRNNCVELYGKRFFPIFPISEKGGLHRSVNSVIAKVLRAPLTFWRSQSVLFTTTKGVPVREMLLTTKIHFGSSAGANKAKPPILVYLLSKFGFDTTMRMLGIEGTISFTDQTTDDGIYEYIKIPNGLFIRILASELQEQHTKQDNRVLRTLVSLYSICWYHRRFDLSTLMGDSTIYWKAALGKYINPGITKEPSLIENAKLHINMNDTLIDPIAQMQLRTVGLEVTDFYDFLQKVFLTMDQWLNRYNPIDLCEKKVGAMDQMMGSVVRKIFSKVYRIINNRNVGVDHANIKSFMRSASYQSNWLSKNPVFRCNPSQCNDNWLLGIGAKRVRTLQNTDTGSSSKSASKATLPVQLLKAHSSQLIVESILDIPSSNPVTAGSINPYLQISLGTGDILRPEWASELDTVYR